MDEKIELFLKDNNETAKEYLERFKYNETIEKYDIQIQDERDDLNLKHKKFSWCQNVTN